MIHGQRLNMGQSGSTETQLRDYARAVWKRKAVAGGVLATLFLPVLVYILFIQTPQYYSTAVVMVKAHAGSTLAERPTNEMADVATEIEVMKSPPATARAVSVLEAAGLDPVRWLKEVEWNRVQNASVVHITAIAPAPEVASDVANALADGYIDYCRTTSLSTSRTTVAWLEREVSEARTRMQQDERTLQEFCRQRPAIALPETGSFEHQYYAALLKDARDVDLAALQAKAQLSDYAALMEHCGISPPGEDAAEAEDLDLEADPAALAQLTAMSNSERLSVVTAELRAAQAALREKQVRLKAHHPEIIQLNQQVNAMQSNCRAVLVAESRKGYSDRLARLTQVQSLQAQKTKDLDGCKSQLLQTSGDRMEYSLLSANAAAESRLYGAMVEKLKQSDLAGGALSDTAQLIQRGPQARRKDSYDGVKLAFAFLCGSVLGIATALFVDYLDTTLKAAQDVEQALDLPVLAVIPGETSAPEQPSVEEVELVVALN